jgi:hypothetical protein
MVTIQVTDAEDRMTSGPFRIAVLPAPRLNLSLTPTSRTLDPVVQIPVQLTIPAPCPADVFGRLTIVASDPDATLLQNGASVGSVPFAIRAGSTAATFAAGAVLLQSGTSSDPFSLIVSADVPNQSATQQYSVPPLAPRLTAGQFSPTAEGFVVSVDGFSTTREVQTATFQFHYDTVLSAPYTISVAGIFRDWFQSATASGRGVFLYRQPFTITGSGSITAVDVTLTNSAGTSSILTLRPEVR